MFMTKREKWLIYGLMILATLVTVVPFIWMLITSFKTQAESIAFPPILLPANPGFQAYGKILHEMPFGSFYFNSIVSTLVIVILQTLIAAMAASLMCWGVSNAGSPAARLTTSTPAFFSS